jgi:hypothetical protein
MSATKKLMALPPNHINTARTWYQFVGDIRNIDKIALERISEYETVVSDRECSVFLRWWNYLPPNLIEPRDTDLYDTLTDFLYDG